MKSFKMTGLPLVLAGALIACTPSAEAPASPAGETSAAVHPVSGLPIIPVTVTSDGVAHEFAAEYASLPEERRRGLMFRTELGADEAMIFDFSEEAVTDAKQFWMGNTYIPLDIIFIGPDRRVLNVAADMQPLTSERANSEGPAMYVLEIPGGRAAELGIGPGDMLSFTAPGR